MVILGSLPLPNVSSRKQPIILQLHQLMERAHTDKSAATAVDRYNEIEKAGGNPEIRFSDFNSYNVIDRNA